MHHPVSSKTGNEASELASVNVCTSDSPSLMDKKQLWASHVTYSFLYPGELISNVLSQNPPSTGFLFFAQANARSSVLSWIRLSFSDTESPAHLVENCGVHTELMFPNSGFCPKLLVLVSLDYRVPY